MITLLFDTMSNCWCTSSVFFFNCISLYQQKTWNALIFLNLLLNRSGTAKFPSQ